MSVNIRKRKSPRRKGYNYGQPGEYFVTICAKNSTSIFGRIEKGVMIYSEIGKIVQSCWKEIPVHFTQVCNDIFQIMPNHLHGIIEIKDLPPNKETLVGTRHAVSLQEFKTGKFGKPERGSLSTILGSFKSAATKLVHDSTLTNMSSIWQPRFHDHIIRSAKDRFYIERYILLNPILWELDAENATTARLPIDQLESILRDVYKLEGEIVERIVDYEVEYRQWAEFINVWRR